MYKEEGGVGGGGGGGGGVTRCTHSCPLQANLPNISCQETKAKRVLRHRRYYEHETIL